MAEREVLPGGRGDAAALALVRLALGAVLLVQAGATLPPAFGRSSASGLWAAVQAGLVDPVAPPATAFLRGVVLPHWTAAGWVVLVLQAALAVLLLAGALVRAAGVGAAVLALAVALVLARAPDQQGWAQLLLVAAGLALAVGDSGRVAAVSSLRRGGAARRRARRLARGWGLVALLAAAWAGVAALADRPVWGRAHWVGDTGLGLGAGSFDLLGALLLAGCGAAMVLASLGASALAPLAAVVAAVSAALVGVGLVPGTTSSLVLLAVLALVAGAASSHLRPDGDPPPA